MIDKLVMFCSNTIRLKLTNLIRNITPMKSVIKKLNNLWEEYRIINFSDTIQDNAQSVGGFLFASLFVLFIGLIGGGHDSVLKVNSYGCDTNDYLLYYR